MNGFITLTDGRRIEVRQGLTFGRVAGNDVVIDDSKASRKHARLIVEGGVVEIEDLGSSNGTLLNGKPVTRKVVRDGDEIQIGATVIRYAEGGAAVAPTVLGAADKPAAAPVVHDDDDLFGGPAVTPVTPVPPVKGSVPSPASPAPAPVAPPRAYVPPSPPPPAPPKPAVVEFEDEIVEVKQPTKPTTPGAAAPAASSEPQLQRTQRILQFSKQKDSGRVLGDDLSQMSGGMRAMIVLVVLAAAAGLGWLMMNMVG